MPEKKRFQLTPEKKQLLKTVIMARAKELQQEAALRKLEERNNYVKSTISTIEPDSMDEAALKQLCSKLHKMLVSLTEDEFDADMRLMKQEGELNELNMKLNDKPGRFVKPVLKKVAAKTN